MFSNLYLVILVSGISVYCFHCLLLMFASHLCYIIFSYIWWYTSYYIWKIMGRNEMLDDIYLPYVTVCPMLKCISSTGFPSLFYGLRFGGPLGWLEAKKQPQWRLFYSHFTQDLGWFARASKLFRVWTGTLLLFVLRGSQ